MGAILYKLSMGVYGTVLALVGFIATFEALILAIIGQRFNVDFYVARTFYYMCAPIIGWYIEMEGEEHLLNLQATGPAVILGNHQSMVDILYLGRMFPKQAAIMAKKSLKWVPGLGTFMMLSGSVFLDRKNNKSAVAMMNAAGDEMKRKKISVFVFPEGTRHLSDEPFLLPFKKGAFHMAIRAGVPIVPVVCENYSKLLKPGKYFRRGTLKLRVLPPVSTEGVTSENINELIEKVQTQMLSALKDISVPAPASPVSSTATIVDRASKGKSVTQTNAVEDSDASDETEVEENVSESDGEVPASKPGKIALAMVSDFFHPDVGGVEGHIYSLSVEMARRGHKVIVITHHHGRRVGIRYLAPGIKVYHVPFVPLASSASLPNYLLFLPYFRSIILRERIQLVHGHGTLSSLAHEAMHHGPLFGVRTVFTDHSLFGFADTVGVLTNKLLASALRTADAVICVSNTGRENTVLRAELPPERVNVIPNALVPSQFEPAHPPREPESYITIVVISRLVYRKGIDLLVASAPAICDLFPRVRFLVGGDGPKMVDLLQMREKYELQDRIELVGSVRPSDVHGLLTRGQIYLNTSLTEAFGISIIEAACSGLFVVATRVGGVPEILPADMIEFARADEDDVIRALSHAIQTVQSGQHDPITAHERVKTMYSWAAVAERTEQVYERVFKTPQKSSFERLAAHFAGGPVFGPILCAILAVQWWFLWFLEIVLPREGIDDVMADWDAARFADAVEREKKAAKMVEADAAE
ncbi:uncharacterized protein CcaverHIS019_0605960 [Cutaneotrichosporon cavernicola]|uniref:1-acyl-sn-glycerol-3-phosphate acyltransferase n=1 Tax=Cutaneotrichosporon cavernicola TaxID=279322 RepID=A0AA48L8X0_9TREE|nr:uncharacterized protein CcaverHIS019_0605960 [Cutaneotrichosporon cavernicola]BEI94137.1 hypothetical protein CcaverHIS019_0605960 [Cutaneotrichosporon cavernicola]BEJ01917.1 hypothetical protein CcaverHIS631_0605990 [Cutaneotrichosporon cavernicola]BEJ09681.1 hypothetical protein CcaverHIS641_0605960 [Cutaneotrichosporon cavernicola]